MAFDGAGGWAGSLWQEVPVFPDRGFSLFPLRAGKLQFRVELWVFYNFLIRVIKHDVDRLRRQFIEQRFDLPRMRINVNAGILRKIDLNYQDQDRVGFVFLQGLWGVKGQRFVPIHVVGDGLAIDDQDQVN